MEISFARELRDIYECARGREIEEDQAEIANLKKIESSLWSDVVKADYRFPDSACASVNINTYLFPIWGNPPPFAFGDLK